MMRSWIKIGIAVGLLTAGGLPAETLYEKDGIALEGSVRMAGRNAATCQVLAESESAEAYEQNKAHHGRPLHVWRVDYSAFNGSGKPLSQITAHFRIQSEWPPCTNWTGLAQYPGPVQWAGSFETLQRTGGLEPGGEAVATLYVLAIDGEQPRFANWQVDFRFGETAAKPLSSVAPDTRAGSSASACTDLPGTRGRARLLETAPRTARLPHLEPRVPPGFRRELDRSV